MAYSLSPSPLDRFYRLHLYGRNAQSDPKAPDRDAEAMLKTFVVAVLVIAMSVGVAEARGARHVHQAKAKHVHRHKATVTKHVQTNAIAQKNAIPMCAEGQQVANTCACGTDASGRPFMCQEGQLCRTLAHACTQ